MTHYALARSPFGNFAVNVHADDSAHTVESFTLTPIGDLEAVPLRTMHDGTIVIDHDALAAEAERQLAARGMSRHPHLTPRPTFKINRVHYTDDVTVTLRRYSHGSQYLAVRAMGIFTELSDSARTKLADWWESVRDSIVTPEFIARDRYEQALSDERWAQRRADEARRAVDEADAQLWKAQEEVAAASAGLDATTTAASA